MGTLKTSLVPRATHALDVACAVTRDSQADVVNRALQVYAFLVKAEEEGKSIIVEDPISKARDRLALS